MPLLRSKAANVRGLQTALRSTIVVALDRRPLGRCKFTLTHGLRRRLELRARKKLRFGQVNPTLIVH
jgi:hypothetical protein